MDTDLKLILRDAVSDFFLANGTRLLAEEWRRRDPDSDTQVAAFYRETPLYVWDLANWHMTDPRVEDWIRFVVENSGERVLDFGAGIGTYSLALAHSGRSVWYSDVPDSVTENFARFLFSKYFPSLNVQIFDSDDPIRYRRFFDTIVCIDVLEHLPNPYSALEDFSKWLVEGGTLICTYTPVEELYPQHISDIDVGLFPDLGFEQVGDTWPMVWRLGGGDES